MCGRIPLWNPDSEFISERLAQARRPESSPGPQDQWRLMEDRSATAGQTFSAKFSDKVLEDSVTFDNGFGGAQLFCTEGPPSVVLPGYSPAQDDRERAGKDWGWLAFLGEIH